VRDDLARPVRRRRARCLARVARLHPRPQHGTSPVKEARGRPHSPRRQL